MLHSRLQDMLDEMLSDPDELFIASNSLRSALISLRGETTFFIEGDFSGTQDECEAEARRILKGINLGSSRRRVRS